MNAKLRKRSRCSRRALTLIEVVASLALLATLLASVLAAHGRLARQARLSQERLSAMRQLDQLIAQWIVADKLPLGDGGGLVPGQADLVWAAATRPVVAADSKWSAAILQVEIYRRDGPAGSPPLASVELLIDPETNKDHDQPSETAPEVEL
jgi:type II secretory pathway pseudopilin PulG